MRQIRCFDSLNEYYNLVISWAGNTQLFFRYRPPAAGFERNNCWEKLISRCFLDYHCNCICNFYWKLLYIIIRIMVICILFTVACSTVTVTKCQAALKTLQAFSFFRPTCLCKEPHVDPECNSFQNFLFDHPCIYVLKKGKFI